MSFNFNSVLANMKTAAVDAVKDDLEEIPVYLRQIFEKEKEALKRLAEARITGEISESVFNHEMGREKDVLEVEMLTISIMTKAIAQKAINAALNVLTEAVRMAI